MEPVIFSLTRFFNQKTRAFPCWLAGRFYPQTDHDFELKSQGLSLLCHTKKKVEAEKGDWAAVQIEKLEEGEAYIKEWKILSHGQGDFTMNKQQVFLSQDWSYFLKFITSFFESRDLISVETPSLVASPSVEPHLSPFQTEFQTENQNKKLFLIPSPEMHLKRLLCQDWTDFFEIKKCFRNGEMSSLHEPEFYMLEWYRAFFSLDDLIQEMFDLLKFLNQQEFFLGKITDFKIYSVRDLFLKFLNFPLTPKTTREDLLQLVKREDLIHSEKDSWSDLFHILFLNKIENQLDFHQATIVRDYPPLLRAYSRLNSKGWADRFELYFRNLELANAFYEVIDAKEQKQLFEDQLKEGRKNSCNKKRDWSYDVEFLDSMSQGMPFCAGVALGLDRLFMACKQKTKLAEIKLFSHEGRL